MKIFKPASIFPGSFIVLLLSFESVFAQDVTSAPVEDFKAGDATVTKILSTPIVGFRNEPTEDLDWQPIVKAKLFEHENPAPDEELIEAIKAEREKEKELAEQARIGSGETIQSTFQV